MGESRTIQLLTEWAILEKMLSSKGNEPTQMGIWKAMWRWASLKENRDTAWGIYKQHNTVSFENWKRKMIEVHIPSAWQHPTIPKRDKFLKENGWI